MTRELTRVSKLTLQRGEPLVPCAYATTHDERWDRQLQSCGAMVPHHPRNLCPSCGNKLVAVNAPAPTADSRVVKGDTVIFDRDTGLPAVVHVRAATAIAHDMVRTLRGVTFDGQVYANLTTTARLSGITVTHRTFGFAPPQVMRRRYGCSRSVFNREEPEAMAVLTEFCRVAERMFRTYANAAYTDTAHRVVDKIAPAWRIAGTPWTSGIINRTAALPYHLDRDNIPLSWSAMIVARKNVEGGFLHLADYDTYLAVPHGSITLFDGQSVVHGVTPMKITGPNAHRYSAVVYAKSAMCKCAADPADEPRRAAMAATEAEDRRRLNRITT